MSVCGFDIGNQSCVLAVARKRGIDVLDNECSNRLTPSVVGYGERDRSIGEKGATEHGRNLRNTIASVKRLVGRKYDDPVVQTEIQRQPFSIVKLEDGSVGVNVVYRGEETTFSMVQVLASLMGKLKLTVTESAGLAPADCVFSVPAYYSYAQRKAVLDAANIAGLNCMSLLNETVAAALSYGITKTDLPTDKPRHVAFVDVGESATTATLVAFKKGELLVLSHSFDENLGGRDFDDVMLNFFAEDFKERFQVDVFSNKRALFRMRQACEKAKKVLSPVGVPETLLQIECLLDDKDVRGKITREEFESLSQRLLNRLTAVLGKLFEGAEVSVKDVDEIEIIGGGTRVPMVQKRLEDFFGKQVSRTLNNEEAIAKGCALQAAILSPIFRVRDFSVKDAVVHPVNLAWSYGDSAMDSGDNSLGVFPRWSPFPRLLDLKLKYAPEITLELLHADVEGLPAGTAPRISSAKLTNVPAPKGEKGKVRVLVRMDLHGLPRIENVQLCEEFVEEVEMEVEEPPAADKADAKQDAAPAAAENGTAPAADGDAADAAPAADDKMEVDSEGVNSAPAPEESADAAAEPPKAKKVKKTKKTVKKTDLPLAPTLIGLEQGAITSLFEKESEMALQDRIVIETEAKRNEVESYVYEMRRRLEGDSSELGPYVQDDVRQQFLKALDDAENWLYEDGEDAQKSEYVGKLVELQRVGQPIVYRSQERTTLRPAAAEALRASLQHLSEEATSGEEKYSHIEDAEKQKIVSECASAGQWLQKALSDADATPLHQDAPVKAADIDKKRAEIEAMANAILSKPKPAPKPAPKDDKKKEAPQEPSNDDTPAENGAAEGDAAAAGTAADDAMVDDAADAAGAGEKPPEETI